MQREILGRVLGPAKGEGNEMAQWILKANGRVVPRRTAVPLNIAKLNSETENKKRTIFDQLISKIWGTSISPPDISDHAEHDKIHDPYEDEDEPACAMPEFFDPVDDDTNKLLDQQPSYDLLIHYEIILPHRDKIRNAKILRRSLDPTGRSVGCYHKNPILNTLVYDVEFPDGEVKEYSANVIAENPLSQVDDEGFLLTVFDSILEYTKDDSAIEKKDLYFKTRSGKKRMRKTTCGWEFLVLWKDVSKTWVPLKDMK